MSSLETIGAGGHLPNKSYEFIDYRMFVGTFCKVEAPPKILHSFTFLESDVEIPILSGEYRISLWTAYLASCHPEIRITPLENVKLRQLLP